MASIPTYGTNNHINLATGYVMSNGEWEKVRKTEIEAKNSGVRCFAFTTAGGLGTSGIGTYRAFRCEKCPWTEDIGNALLFIIGIIIVVGAICCLYQQNTKRKEEKAAHNIIQV